MTDEKDPLKKILYPPSDAHAKAHKTIRGADGREQQIYYEEYGNKDGEPVFVLHGGPGYGTSGFYSQYFDPKFYHIICFDQRNAKRSLKSAQEHPEVLPHCSSRQMMEDINKLAEEFGVDFSGKDKTKPHKKIHLMGGSWGSALGLYYAAHYPERLHSLSIRAVTFAEAAELNKLHAVDAHGVPLLKIEMEKNGQDWEKMRGVWEEFVELAKDKAPQFGDDYVTAYRYLLTNKDVDQDTRRDAGFRWTVIEHLSGDVEPGHDADWVKKDVKASMTEDECVSYAAIENNWIAHINNGDPEYFAKKGDAQFNWFAHEADINGKIVHPLDQISKVPLIRVVHGKKDVVCFMKDTDWLQENLEPRIEHNLKSRGFHGEKLKAALRQQLHVERPAESGHMISDPGIAKALVGFSNDIRDIREAARARGEGIA